MAKSNGLGDKLLVAGYDISNDVASIANMQGGAASIPVTGIDKSAMERIGGQRSGVIDFATYLNDATGKQHLTLRGLPATDVHTMYLRGAAIGNSGACLIGKQADYRASRPSDGSMGFAVQMLSNGYGIEMDGRQLTAGIRTDTGATNGSSDDELAGSPASTDYGWSAYLQVTEFTGTDATVKIQDSADNSAWSDITDAAFTQITNGPTYERKQSSSATATVRRYTRVITITTGGFSSLSFAVVFIRPRELRTF